MSSIRDHEDPRFAKQLNRLDHFNRFISEIATVIVSGNDDFENVWSIANRVYDRYCSPKVRFMTRPGLDESGRTALSA
jgi:hypothetical protein